MCVEVWPTAADIKSDISMPMSWASTYCAINMKTFILNSHLFFGDSSPFFHSPSAVNVRRIYANPSEIFSMKILKILFYYCFYHAGGRYLCSSCHHSRVDICYLYQLILIANSKSCMFEAF